ncbi:CRAL/TRIO domain-containing protein [Penicillium riverlandense]|uniref:CRAL/TRIO domain-containing protein n=1 Tax=Penicillium riverlandense TaxID=1903569 RepID=UPI0025492757|nr:CRAL/TRIO domain-containing protein [Penicillium riverlandense]KAJ5819742.1 CRAL/TRIO domain-containing protein [Penicillium riverlandense]
MSPPIDNTQSLSTEATTLIDEFKALCVKNGFNDFRKEENTDETTILRFLRAQRYDVGSAFQQFHYFQTWRRANNIRVFYEHLDVETYDESRKMYPQWIGRRDQDGRPVYVFQVRQLTKKKLDSYLYMLAAAPRPSSHSGSDIPIYILHLHALHEASYLGIHTHCGHQQCQHPSILEHSQVLQEASKIATAHYPETLGRVFVVGAPAFFKSVWDAISQWFDPETRLKIFILSLSESKSFLLSHVDASDLPKEYGGELDWQWQDQPNLDESTRRLVDDLYHKTDRGEIFPKGPIIYQDSCIRLVGSVDGSPRHNAFCRIATPSL